MGGMAEMPPGGPSLTGRGTAPFEQPMRGGEIYLRSKHPLRRWSSNFSVHTVAWEPCSTTESGTTFTGKWTQRTCSGAQGPPFPTSVPVTVTHGETLR